MGQASRCRGSDTPPRHRLPTAIHSDQHSWDIRKGVPVEHAVANYQTMRINVPNLPNERPRLGAAGRFNTVVPPSAVGSNRRVVRRLSEVHHVRRSTSRPRGGSITTGMTPGIVFRQALRRPLEPSPNRCESGHDSLGLHSHFSKALSSCAMEQAASDMPRRPASSIAGNRQLLRFGAL